jgi:hypothetical protein
LHLEIEQRFSALPSPCTLSIKLALFEHQRALHIAGIVLEYAEQTVDTRTTEKTAMEFLLNEL